MKTGILSVFIFFALFAVNAYGQNERFVVNEKEFASVFNGLTSGNRSGTANGVLLVKGSDGREIILDFQGSRMEFAAIPDEDEVYDTAVKTYTAYTTSGKSCIEYRTYAYANGIAVEYGGKRYELSGIDGACDMVVAGLSYQYMAEREAEYLILTVGVSVPLKSETNNEYITLQKGSVIVLAVKR